MKNLITLSALVLLTPAVRAAVLPVEAAALPLSGASLSAAAAPSAALTLKSVPLPLMPSAPSLPSFPAPVQGPMRLPGAERPLPLALPAQLPSALPASLPSSKYHLDWSFLDDQDGEASAAVVPAGPGPKPLPPSGAAAQLTFASRAAKKDLAGVVSAVFDRSRVLVSAE